jgi:hypothetical protein
MLDAGTIALWLFACAAGLTAGVAVVNAILAVLQ